MCPHESPGRLLESVSDYRSRWMVILDRIRLIGRLFFFNFGVKPNLRSLSAMISLEVPELRSLKELQPKLCK